MIVCRQPIPRFPVAGHRRWPAGYGRSASHGVLPGGSPPRRCRSSSRDLRTTRHERSAAGSSRQREGSVFQRADGKWRAVLDLGWPNGRRQRKAATRETRREAVAWLNDAVRAKREGTLVTERLTVEQWFPMYLAEVAAPRVSASTLVNYRRDFERRSCSRAAGRTTGSSSRHRSVRRLIRATTFGRSRRCSFVLGSGRSGSTTCGIRPPACCSLRGYTPVL